MCFYNGHHLIKHLSISSWPALKQGQSSFIAVIHSLTYFSFQMNPKVILAYIKAGGMPTFIVVVVSLLLFSVAQVLTNIWLSTVGIFLQGWVPHNSDPKYKLSKQ